MTLEASILIIGGGPAGLSTGLHLVKLAPHLSDSILLLEKEHYPRPKLCAGGLTADAEILLEGLGLDVSEVPHVDTDTAHFNFAGKGFKIQLRPRTLRLRQMQVKTLRNVDKNRSASSNVHQRAAPHTLRIIRRDEFDAWLAEKAESRGIGIREGVTVQDVRLDDDGVTVFTDKGEFRAQVVIGADGSNGVKRRCVLPHAPVYTARVLEVITPRPHRPGGHLPQIRRNSVVFGGGQGRGREGRVGAVFDFLPVSQGVAGYIWDFPTQIKGQPMRCWGIYDANLLAGSERPPLKELLREEMARHGFDLDDYELEGHPVRWFDPSNPMAAPRVLLVGDAAGADPLFGEGISFALGYGLWAAKETERAFSRGDFSFNGSKFRLARSALGQALFARWFIANIVYAIQWRWFQMLLWRYLKPVVIVVAWLFILNWGRRMQA